MSGGTLTSATPQIKIFLTRSSKDASQNVVVAEEFVAGSIKTKSPSSGVIQTSSSEWTGLAKCDSQGNPYTYTAYETYSTTADADIASSFATVAFVSGTHYKLGDGYYYTADLTGASKSSTQASDGVLPLTISNTINPPEVTIKKYATPSESNTLSGAVFKLVKVTTAGDPAVETETVITTLSPTTTNGLATFVSSVLTGAGPGTYRIYEQTAPTGFVKYTGYVRFTLNADGTITGIANSSAMEGGQATDTFGILDTPSLVVTVNTISGNTDAPVLAMKLPNVPTTVNVTVKKTWERWNGTTYESISNDAAGIPDSINVALQKTTAATPTEANWTQVGSVYTLSKSEYTGGKTIQVQEYDHSTLNSPVRIKYRFVETNASGTALTASDPVVTGSRYYPDLDNHDVTAYINTSGGSCEQTLNNKDTPVSAKVWKYFNPTNETTTVDIGLYQTTDNNTWTLVSGPFSLNSHGANNKIDNLPRQDTNGALYTYKFFEVVDNGGSANPRYTKTEDGELYKGYRVTYSSHESPTVEVEQDITNRREKVPAFLTKNWTSTTADYIYVALERANNDGTFTSLGGSGGGALMGVYKITKGSTTPTVEMKYQATELTGNTVTAGGSATSWTLNVTGLNHYRSNNSENVYRFVEINSTTCDGINDWTAGTLPTTIAAGYVGQGGQNGSYLVSYGDGTGSAGSIGAAAFDSTDSRYEETITNTPANIRLDIYKIVSETYNTFTGKGTGLNDAQFVLQKVDGGTTTTICTFTTAGTGEAKGNADMATSSPVVTGGIGDGEYVLYESVAPNGYAMHSGKVTFTVSAGAITALTINNSGANYTAAGLVEASMVNDTGLTGNPKVPKSDLTTTVGVRTYHFVFENTAGTELPGTGTVFGLSRMGFASLGTVLLAAFVAVYQYKKRRQYYGEWKE